MASYAYLLCAAFIVYLLVYDHRHRTSVSITTWIPVIMLFVLSTRTPLQWMSAGQDASYGFAPDRSGNFLDQLFLASFIGISFIISLVRGVSWGKVIAANLALVVLYAYFTLSVAWSYSPADSLIRVVKDFGSTVIVISLMWSEKKPLEAIRAVYVRCAYVLIPLSAVLVRFSAIGKGYSHDGETVFCGAATTKNTLGELLLISILFLLWDHVENRRAAGAKQQFWRGITWHLLVLLFLGFWLLEVSQSKTSLVALLIALALAFRTGWLASQSVSRLVFGAALMYPVLALSIQKLQPIFAPILGALGRDATFTGRTNIWQHITFNTVNPVIGAGFWNFWGGPGGKAIEGIMQTGIPNAHDGYLDIYLDGGLIGVFLLACVLIACGRRLIKNLPTDRFTKLKYAFFIAAIFHNVTESSFARPSGMWFTIVLALITFPVRQQEVETSPEPEDKLVRHLPKTKVGTEKFRTMRPPGQKVRTT
ncbi:MAG TPA: O-antigen ligase family protein [Candidatus Dormibacteraeota bacterium]|jgi:exopolysaccharide production protein ExoQ|nr:O-antigen ligase family protein [Candidatus Dormibacteraeota bacterium]